MSIIDGSGPSGLIRQGDLLLVPVASLPEQTWEAGSGRRLVLAEGEATGHAHVIVDDRAELRREAFWNGRRFVVVEEGATVALEHDEHDTLSVPAGVYEVRIQREYSPRGFRQVSD